MKIAERFPIKPYPPLVFLFALMHLLLIGVSVVYLNFFWQYLIVIPVILASFYFSLKQYERITRAADDLCWNGNSWLMHSGDQLNALIFLQIEPSSWLTSKFCLLHFSCLNKKHYWLFTKKELGERQFSHLVYIVRLELKHSQTNSDPMIN